MPRHNRVIIPGVAHHITQRGNNQQNIFLEPDDFKNYCFWINKYSGKYGVEILAYCIMCNHVHLVAIPSDKTGLSRVLHATHTQCALYFNHKYKQNGHVWQGRFFSCPMDDVHLYFTLRYVERNPVRAGIVSCPWDYAWSSARWHVGEKSETYILVKEQRMLDKPGWKEYLSEGNVIEIDDRIRRSTLKGLAFAGESVIEDWERKFNCILREKKT